MISPLSAQQPDAVKPTAEQLEFFEKNIRPLFVTHCHKCHSRTSKPLKGGLLLDHANGLSKGGDSGPAVVPGKPAESLVLSALRYDELKMPPGGKLPEAVAKDFETWIQLEIQLGILLETQIQPEIRVETQIRSEIQIE